MHIINCIKTMNKITSILYVSFLVFFTSFFSFSQKWRSSFQFEKEMKVVGIQNQLRLENTVVVKLKPEYAYLLEKTDTEIKELIYPLDVKSFKPLLNPSKHKAKKKNDINLHLIYTLQYTPSTMALDGVINFLSEFNYFEYCEPYYVPMSAAYIPSDPKAQPASSQYYQHNNMKAYDAWGVEKGNASIIIGIVDTGFETTHEDLKNNFAPGWDVADNDANVLHPTDGHGTEVAGTCSAQTDNAIGISGTGFNCKFMPIKAASDGGNSIVAGYAGIYFAAENGCKVMNLSWGGMGGYSSALQDIINYAAITFDVVIVASAGNSDMEGDFFPAAYDHVLSVCAMDTTYSPTAGKTIDIRSRFRDNVAGLAGTYAYSVDIGANGTYVPTTGSGNTYIDALGSSFSSPLVAGAAGLLRSKYPNLNALQIIELLRVTADTFYHYTENMPFKEKLGKGRLNMYRALTDNTSPAIRMLSYTAKSKHGDVLLSKDTVTVVLNLWNYLRKTNNLTVDLSTTSSNVTIVNNAINIGLLDSMQGKNTTLLPLKFKVNSNASLNATVTFRLGFTDPVNGYFDYQYFKIKINPSSIDISTSKILSTITNNGNIGYDQIPSGSGYKFNGTDLLYESGLMIATTTKVSDCVRGASPGFVDNHFKPTSSPTYIDPAYKDVEIMNKMNDSLATSIIGVSIEQRSYAFNQPGLDQCFIVEYKITNDGPVQLDTLYAGLFCDWDVNDYTKNRAEYDYSKKLGYVYSSLANNPYVGVSLLTNQAPTYYAMDNGTVPDINNINPNAGFSTTKKLKTLKSGIGRAQAGMIGTGFDVSNVTGARLLNLAPGKTQTVAFAVLAADNLASLQTNTDAILAKFIAMKTSKVPTGDTYYLCDGETKNIIFTPGNGNNFNFYSLVTDAIALAQANNYTAVNASTATTIYVAGADSLYESTSRTPMYINNSSTAKANFGQSATTLTPGSPLYLFNSSLNYTSISWDYGDGATETNIDNPSHIYTVGNTYTITLTATDNKGCSSSKQQNVIVSIGTGIKTFPNPANNNLGFGDDITEEGNMQIVNSIGQLIYQKENTLLSNTTIETTTWPQGVYTILFTALNKQYTQKILVRH